MARPPRSLEVIPGHPHHLVLRGNNRRNLFSCTQDRLRFLRLMAEAPGAEDCLVSGAALMTNHGHKIVTPPSAEVLARWIKSFAQRYAVARNHSRGASGKLFEQRYWIKAIRTERQLAATSAYVDLNAMKAGRSSLWTTLALHAGVGVTHPALAERWRPSDWWLALGSNDADRHAAYRSFALDDDAWLSDVIAPDEPAPATYDLRPTRPDGARVAEEEGAYGEARIASGPDRTGDADIASMDPQNWMEIEYLEDGE